MIPHPRQAGQLPSDEQLKAHFDMESPDKDALTSETILSSVAIQDSPLYDQLKTEQDNGKSPTPATTEVAQEKQTYDPNPMETLKGKLDKENARLKDSADYAKRIEDHNNSLKAEKEFADKRKTMIDTELYKTQINIGQNMLNLEKSKHVAEATAKVDAELGIVKEVVEGPSVTEQRQQNAEATQSEYAQQLKAFDSAILMSAAADTDKKLEVS